MTKELSYVIGIGEVSYGSFWAIYTGFGYSSGSYFGLWGSFPYAKSDAYSDAYPDAESYPNAYTYSNS